MRFGECQSELRLRDGNFWRERFSIYHSALLSLVDPVSRRTSQSFKFMSVFPPCFLNFKSLFQDDPQTASSRHFYISQWYRDSDAEIRKNSKKTKPRRKDKSEKSRRRGRRGRDSESETSEDEDDEDDDERQEEMPAMNAEVYRLTEARKEYLVSKICPFGPTSQRSTTLASHIDSTAACLIVK